MSTTIEILRVSATTRPQLLATAIVGELGQHGSSELQAVGAAAVNQAVKAIAIARGYLAVAGLRVVCEPEFTVLEIDGQARTGIRFVVSTRQPGEG